MKYDDASWHYGGNFPDELMPEAGATHMGIFLAWALLNELGGAMHTEDFPEELERLRERQTTPAQYFINSCDEKFTDEDLNDEGNAFAAEYYSSDGEMGQYIRDYEEILGSDVPTLYHVLDTWESFDRLSPRIQQRYEDWKARKG